MSLNGAGAAPAVAQVGAAQGAEAQAGADLAVYHCPSRSQVDNSGTGEGRAIGGVSRTGRA